MTVTLRAKMRVNSVQSTETQDIIDCHAVGLSSKYPDDGTDENNTYAKYTPEGSLNLTITNPDLLGQINAGDELILDITSVDKSSRTAAGKAAGAAIAKV